VPLALAAIALGVGLMLLGYWTQHSDAVSSIKRALEERGASDVDVRLDLFDFDASTLTYDVGYRDGGGALVRTRCKRHVGWAGDRTLYWQDRSVS
jgi:hypothetical protein